MFAGCLNFLVLKIQKSDKLKNNTVIVKLRSHYTSALQIQIQCVSCFGVIFRQLRWICRVTFVLCSVSQQKHCCTVFGNGLFVILVTRSDCKLQHLSHMCFIISDSSDQYLFITHIRAVHGTFIVLCNRTFTRHSDHYSKISILKTVHDPHRATGNSKTL